MNARGLLRISLVLVAAGGCAGGGQGGNESAGAAPGMRGGGGGGYPGDDAASGSPADDPRAASGSAGLDARPSVTRGYLPLRVGAWWQYNLRPVNGQASGADAGGSKKTVVQARENLTGDKAGIVAFRIVTTSTRNGAPPSTSFDERRGGVVVRHEEMGPDGRKLWFPGKQRFDENPARLAVGATWTEKYREAKLTDNGNLRLSAERTDRWTMEALDEVVVVPAGRFTCARVRLDWSEVSVDDGARKGVKRYWFAGGIGKVVEESADQIEELAAWSVPPGSDDADAADQAMASDGGPDVRIMEPPVPLPTNPVFVSRAPLVPNFGALVNAPVPPPPLAGGTLLVMRDGRTAVASDADRDRIVIVDLVTEKVTAEIPVLRGDEPGRLVEDDDGRVHVALRRSGAVLTLRGPRWAVAMRRPVCPAPRGLAHEPGQDLLHVACAGGELVSLPASGGAPVRTLRLDADLRDVLVDGDHLLVSRFRSAEVLAIERDGRVSARGAPAAVRDRQRVPSDPMQPSLMTPSVAWRMLSLPGSGGALVLHQRATTGLVGTVGAGAYVGGGPGGSPDPCNTIVQAVLSSLTPGQPAKPAPALARVTLAVDLALAPDGRRAALLDAGGAWTPTVGSRVLVGRWEAFARDPVGQGCLDPGANPSPPSPDAGPPAPGDGDWLDVIERRIGTLDVAGEAIAVAFDGGGRVVVQTREPATLQLPASGRTIVLGGGSRADTGYAIFHSVAGGAIACASCHPDGGEDGRVWNFAPMGPRRTQSLRGGIMAAAPFHWDGDMRDLQTLASVVWTRRMGGPPLAPELVKALARFIDGVPALPVAEPRDGVAVSRGRAIFTNPAVGCATCHAGRLGTNNQNVDVGTGKAFQVAPLIGLAARAPYMHDGCAPTLLARLSDQRCGGDARHGATAGLTAGQLADLVAYLETM